MEITRPTRQVICRYPGYFLERDLWTITQAVDRLRIHNGEYLMLPLFMLLLLGPFANAHWGKQDLRVSESVQVEPLSLCALEANIQKYKGQRVQVRAYISESYENSWLYDPKCRNGEPSLWFKLAPKVTGKLKQLRNLVKKKGYGFVTVEGIVHGPEPIEIDPKLPDWIKEKYRDSIKKYGHMNTYDMEIVIDKILEVTNVDDGRRK
jgi:hypothetical protein